MGGGSWCNTCPCVQPQSSCSEAPRSQNAANQGRGVGRRWAGRSRSPGRGRTQSRPPRGWAQCSGSTWLEWMGQSIDHCSWRTYFVFLYVSTMHIYVLLHLIVCCVFIWKKIFSGSCSHSFTMSMHWMSRLSRGYIRMYKKSLSLITVYGGEFKVSWNVTHIPEEYGHAQIRQCIRLAVVIEIWQPRF